MWNTNKVVKHKQTSFRNKAFVLGTRNQESCSTYHLKKTKVTLGRGVGEKQGERREREQSSPGRKDHRGLLRPCPGSYRGRTAPSAAWLRGAGAFPSPGGLSARRARPLPPAQPQGGGKGRASWKLLPPRRLLGAGLGGERSNA